MPCTQLHNTSPHHWTPVLHPLIFPALAAALVLALLAWPLRTLLRRRQLRQQPFPAAWREILRQRVPYFRQMPTDLQLQLKKKIQVFIAEKPFIGCAGLEITDEMRVTIAAQACLLRPSAPRCAAARCAVNRFRPHGATSCASGCRTSARCRRICNCS